MYLNLALPLNKIKNKIKNKNERTEYYGIFISFKGQGYSKQGSPTFLLFRL